MLNVKPFLIIAALMVVNTISAQPITKWQFLRMGVGSVWEVFRPAKGDKPETVPIWTDVTVPHCWNALDAVDPDVNYYEGEGWYRTHIRTDNPYPDGRTFIEFEGAGQRARVFVYTREVGSHIGGYDRWRVDITDEARAYEGKDLPLAVECSNRRDVEIIPSDMSDFCLYGGLYRKVHLVYEPQSWLEDIKVTTAKGVVSLSATQKGPKENVRIEILDPKGATIYSKVVSEPNMEIAIKKPVRWDIDSPKLYTMRLTVCGKTYERTFGFREYEFREHGPFYLNGRRVLLQGTHRHEDHAGLGAAMSDEQIRREMKDIKNMGANFIRLGHYQQSDLVLSLCDSLGILVWEEIPWCRGGLGGEQYKAQAHRMLHNMITQHAHHPAVILWGMGNENDWPGDFETYENDSIRAMFKSLVDRSHSEDKTRLTCIRRCDFASDIVDVYSPTIWAGWYAASMFDYRKMEQAAIDKYPRFFHAEWGGDSHARRHSEGDFKDIVKGASNSDWSESYMIRLFDWTLKEQLNIPNLTGTAFWTFKDFATPLRPENPIPYVNQKGVVERDGTKKESYYVFQSYWTKKPMIHIYGHTWQHRWGKAGEKKEVLVYSNCREVELFVNGKSEGIRRRDHNDFPAAGLHWYVALNEGKNDIRAVAVKEKISDELSFDYTTKGWGKATTVVADVAELHGDSTLVRARLLDAEGRQVLDSRAWILFSIAGDGRMIDNQGTSRGSRKIQAQNGEASIWMRAQGKAVAGAMSPGVGSAVVELAQNAGTDANTVKTADAAAVRCTPKVLIRIANTDNRQRQEVVEVDAKQLFKALNNTDRRPIVIYNKLGQKTDYQLTHDGKLLIDASVRPHGVAEYEATIGEPDAPIVYAAGRQYPYRKDDIAWENDRTGFRVYGPKFQQDGDIGYGIDVWAKNTPDMVIEKFYTDNCFNKKSFHKDHGYGLDCYNVGASLGCGTPALLVDGAISYPYCYSDYKILDNGPLRFTVQLDFAPRAVGKCRAVSEHRIISLDKGTHYCKMTVWYDGLTGTLPVVAGIVDHSAQPQDCILGKDYMLYADPTNNPAAHNFQIYVGVLFPQQPDSIYKVKEDNSQKGVMGHLLARQDTLKDKQPFTYYFGSAWSKHDVRSLDEWEFVSRRTLEDLRKPLKAVVK